ncbi:MAG TPA: hypothetical protein P5270_06420 [Victivallales bacterium]|nr:hypothetical protein [Victivallales bacterium]HRR28981.1 hypothetical protein [Victivallales bacterium]HRU00417.1 hypothetical protein [Victivallales bacterium]
MKKIRNLLLVGLIISFIMNLNSEDFNCREISIKIKNASDPNSVFQSAKTYIIKQKIEVTGGKKGVFEAEIKYKSPDMLKTSYFFRDKLMNSIIIKGDKIWKISGIDNAAHEITGIEKERIKLFHDISSPKTLLCDVFDDMKIERVKINDEDLLKIICHPKKEDLPQITFFVAEGNYLQRRMLTTNENGDAYSAEIIKYSLIENVFIPAETKVLTGGIEQRIILEDFRLNTDIPDSEFEIIEKSK